MVGYNIYYSGNKLNDMPLTYQELTEIKKRKTIYKNKMQANSTVLMEIPVKNLNIVKCILV